MKPLLMLSGMALSLCLTGCYTIYNQANQCVMSVRDRYAACEAWGRYEDCYEDVDHRCHFRKGFEAGYRDVAAGGTGCQPDLPPHHYWSIFYQTSSGQAKIMAWFSGFSHGAIAAEQDGIAYMNEIPVSPQARIAATPQPPVVIGLDPDVSEGFSLPLPVDPQALPQPQFTEPPVIPPTSPQDYDKDPVLNLQREITPEEGIKPEEKLEEQLLSE